MIAFHRIWAITQRVLHELGRDPRARVVMLVTPGLLMVIVRQLFDSPESFSRSGVIMVGVFPLFSMYLVGSTSIVRERDKGTLEAVLSTPASRGDIVGGYLGAAVIASFGQAIATVTLGYLVSDLKTACPFWVLGVLAMLSGIFGMSLGLLISAICTNEGQAFQFLPGLMIPQMLVSGIVWPVSQMAGWVQDLEHVLPLSAVSRSMTAVRLHEYGGTSLLISLPILVALIAVSVTGAAATIRRRTA